MSTQSNFHSWANERLDEMDATLSFLEGKVGEVQADLRARADKLLAELRAKQEEFRNTVKKNVDAKEAAFTVARAKLETDWKAFEADVAKYVESFSKRIEQQQAIFKIQAAAQLKAWQEAADKLASDAKQFAAERRTEIDAAVKGMKADAAVAEEKLHKLNEAGAQSWSALMVALAETRASFDRANHAAREAFKRAA
jgi:hypothetical protein